jgi:hypothetical protein
LDLTARRIAVPSFRCTWAFRDRNVVARFAAPFASGLAGFFAGDFARFDAGFAGFFCAAGFFAEFRDFLGDALRTAMGIDVLRHRES